MTQTGVDEIAWHYHDETVENEGTGAEFKMHKKAIGQQ
jgi:hypothetical protein